MTDKNMKAAGGKIKWGVNQFGNETPMVARWCNRIITALIGVYGVIIASTAGAIIPIDLQHQINPYVIVMPSITLTISKSFGWDFSDKADTSNPMNKF